MEYLTEDIILPIIKKKKNKRITNRCRKNNKNFSILNKMNYWEYLRSIYWKKKKESYYTRHEKKCNCCGSTKNIHLHHLSYNNVKFEKDDDLTPLCAKCHEIRHFDPDISII